jgi:hypothetical protein
MIDDEPNAPRDTGRKVVTVLKVVGWCAVLISLFLPGCHRQDAWRDEEFPTGVFLFFAGALLPIVVYSVTADFFSTGSTEWSEAAVWFATGLAAWWLVVGMPINAFIRWWRPNWYQRTRWATLLVLSAPVPATAMAIAFDEPSLLFGYFVFAAGALLIGLGAVLPQPFPRREARGFPVFAIEEGHMERR